MRHAIRLILPLCLLSACVGPSTTTPGGTTGARDTSVKRPGAGLVGKGEANLISDKGAGLRGAAATLVGDSGASLVSNNGAGLTGKVKGPASLISNNGPSRPSLASRAFLRPGDRGSLGSRYDLLQALVQVPLADVPVSLLDAAGKPVQGPDGKPLATRTDAAGGYAFEGIGIVGNLVIAAQLGGGRGQLRAIAHKGADGRPVDVDLASTLTATYLLDEVVKGQQAALDRLSPAAEARLNAEAAAGLDGGKAPLPRSLSAEELKQTLEALRGQAPTLDAELAAVTAALAAPSSPAPTASSPTPALPSPASSTAPSAAPTPSPTPKPGAILRVAGSTRGYADGPGLSAQLNIPYGVVADNAGNLFIADSGNNRIRKLSAAGAVSTVAGSGAYVYADGPGASAGFRLPKGITVDSAGNVYVADAGPDSESQRIRKITPAGVVSTLAGTGEQGYVDGPGASAKFFSAESLAVDQAGNVYVAETSNRIRKITPAGVVSTVAGNGEQGYVDGPAASARFALPYGITLDAAGNLYVVDTGNQRIRKITPAGDVSTVAGSTQGFADGPAASAQFDKPRGITADRAGNLYVADSFNNRIRKITPAGVVSTFADLGSLKAYGITLDAKGYLYFTDQTKDGVYMWSVPTAP